MFFPLDGKLIKTQASSCLGNSYPVQRYRQVIRNKLVCCSWILSSLPTAGAKSCRSDEFHCTSGPCIPAHWYCDHERDCSDGSDEPPTCGKRVNQHEKHCDAPGTPLPTTSNVNYGSGWGMFALLADTPQQIFIKSLVV